MILSQDMIIRGNDHMRALGRPGTRGLTIGEPVWPPARWHFTPQPDHPLRLGSRPTRPRAQKTPRGSADEGPAKSGQRQPND